MEGKKTKGERYSRKGLFYLYFNFIQCILRTIYIDIQTLYKKNNNN